MAQHLSGTKCVYCEHDTPNPHAMDCHHIYCYRCLVVTYNEHIKSLGAAGQESAPTTFPCHLCEDTTTVPVGGLRKMLVSARIAAGYSGQVDQVTLGGPAQVDQAMDQVDQVITQVDQVTTQVDQAIAQVDEENQVTSQVDQAIAQVDEEDQVTSQVDKAMLGGSAQVDQPTDQLNQATTGLEKMPLESGIPQMKKFIKKATLLKYFSAYKDIYDLDFLQDGTLVFTASIDDQRHQVKRGTVIKRKSLYRMNLNGDTLSFPFPIFLKNPTGVATCPRTKTLVVSDQPGDGNNKVHIYREVGGNWEGTTITTKRRIGRPVLTPSGEVICDVHPGHLVKLDPSGQEIWHKALPGTVQYIPYLAVHQFGSIVLSSPKEKVSILDECGNLVHQLSSTFVQEPFGVCLDSAGNILVGDGANKTVSQFTIDGQFMQQIVECEKWPHAIALYQDRYLATGDRSGILLYELEWC